MIRLSISISDALHSRLKPFKTEINLSGICQNALLEEVEVQEAAQYEDLEKLQQLIRVLRRGKTSFGKQWERRGYEDAIKHWTDLRFDDDDSSLFEQFILIVEEGILPSEVYQDLEDEIEQAKEDFEPIKCDFSAYELGYRDGAANIYRRIEDKLEGKKNKPTSK